MIDSFSGDYAFLSNFYSHNIEFMGWIFSTSEHAFQAAKTNSFHEIQDIANATTPGKAKKIGGQVRLRKDWEQIKLCVMETILRIKFHDGRLHKKLLVTYPHNLIEKNTWGDKYWGVCDGEGKNHLGRLLMKIREEEKKV